MKIKLPWIEDEKTGEPSVSLTNFEIAKYATLVAIGLHIFGVTNTTSIVLEYFAISAGLYFGRRFQTNNTKIEGDAKNE